MGEHLEKSDAPSPAQLTHDSVMTKQGLYFRGV
ncbi:hypothetical protein PSPPH_A0111 (plasmid) [Pseudomonas savastanoi pv. phaseolicola 1448A]|uniref:Uncharacterized protein n=1 Tax=Pseudomonas savastanoi pv. phaseolicola (strain 1448A / Race 6) TaxID=264730 RepID=Q48B70_PSE14|nr:hypothetical protein PSPPH_A0111 [Pseudomonas savastanoi pv. phaseolicola 1448A]